MIFQEIRTPVRPFPVFSRAALLCFFSLPFVPFRIVHCQHTWAKSNFEGGGSNFLLQGVVRKGPGRGTKIIFQGGGRVRESHEKWFKNCKRDP